ncbi:hypothetical protein ACFWPV_09655 [Streptomyces uncialis]|uniref:hypothetical protein n=1 Tax=Streptomyces uncialis TaxID=1048205 RepID=UPI0036670F35
MTSPSPAEQTAAVLQSDFPGLRRTHPQAIGVPLHDVELDPAGHTARYTWGAYEVEVRVGPEDHLNRDDPDDAALYRQITAHAALLTTGPFPGAREGAEWQLDDPRPQIMFPAALSVTVADPADPRFASAVLAAVGTALDRARLATAHAGQAAADADRERRWARERPAGVSLRSWLRQMREQHAASQAGQA